MRQVYRRDTCAEGTHIIGYPPESDYRECRKCKTDEQTIYDHPPNAALGDFRVVCLEADCEYGHRVDRDGHGYTNHVSLALAKSALLRHQEDADSPHQAKIEQHPVEAVVEAEGPTAR